MSDNRYMALKITTRPDGSIANLDISSYAPDNGAVSAMIQPIINAVAAAANEDLQQRQQGREQDHELFAAMMKSAEDKAVDAAESAEMTGSGETDKTAEVDAAESAEMTGSVETDKTAESNGASEAEKAVDVLVKRMNPEKVVAVIKRLVKAIS